MKFEISPISGRMSIRFFLFLAILSVCGCGTGGQALREVDAAVVRDMVKAWRPILWDDAGEDPCEWDGIECGVVLEKSGIFTSAKTVRFIKSLTLRDVCRSALERGLDLECIVPPSIGNLNLMEQLFLNGCGLHGVIPASIGEMSKIKALYLNSNELSGNIPASIGNLENLERLFLNSNHLAGKIPPEIGNCKALHVLELQNNELVGRIPAEIGSLSQLVQLDLNDNELDGEIPAVIGKLHNIHRMYLHNNFLSGDIPEELLGQHMASLMKVNLSNNKLTGAVPYGLCKVPRLVYFNAEEGNDLEGTVVTCDAPHGPHAEEENREHCKNQLRESGFCVNMPAHGLHDEL